MEDPKVFIDYYSTHIPKPKVLWGISDNTRKRFPKMQTFIIKRSKYNEWFMYKGSEKLKRTPIEEDDIDNQIANIKQIIRIQRLAKMQDIKVIKDLDNGLITINIK